MEYEVTGDPFTVDFGASGSDAILQNIKTILTTISGTVPLDRKFGVDVPLDQPAMVAQALLTANIIEAIEQYESRVEVVSVMYSNNDNEGILIPIVKFRMKEGEEFEPSRFAGY
ncbi:GPW/gp25 family protein [Paenibacillus sp. GCM10012307]|uniref:GPW/gp25 family protein n=1 Tax=Paenibacillus roseus TaxID=2798579 RepID=A0A934J825_9BACL|nr:GPW/gp25 family protein [Paenibacillus roseus]MBJ6362090.1 GPW/gp25 family protein [Paenibacillus roseus]